MVSRVGVYWRKGGRAVRRQEPDIMLSNGAADGVLFGIGKLRGELSPLLTRLEGTQGSGPRLIAHGGVPRHIFGHKSLEVRAGRQVLGNCLRMCCRPTD